MSSNDATADDTLTFNLTLTAAPSAPRISIKVSKTASASQLRAEAAAATKIPLSSIRLIYRGRLIGSDESNIAATEFKLEDGCVIHCMGKPQESAAAPATIASPVTATSAGASVTLPQVAPPAATVTADTGDPLHAALATLRSSNASGVYLTAVQTLEKVLVNITSHPMEEKYRKVKKQNAAFQRRLGGLTGGDAAMKAVGFTIQTVDGDECYAMVASAEAWPKLVANKDAVSLAVAEAQRATSSGAAPPLAMPPTGASGTGFPGVGAGASGTGFPGMGAPGLGNVPPGMENAVANLMSNPQAMQQMLQNPMVRQMMERDPRFANNPMLRQNLDALASNPEQLSQISQMMQDPNMVRQMQSMMNSGQMPSGMGGGFGGMGNSMGGSGGMGGFGAPHGASGNNVAPTNGASPSTTGAQGGASTTSQTAGSNRNDEEMTEEEMIAEAIARSMRET